MCMFNVGGPKRPVGWYQRGDVYQYIFADLNQTYISLNSLMGKAFVREFESPFRRTIESGEIHKRIHLRPYVTKIVIWGEGWK